MEIMEDGNLVDRVRILLQRDMEYYQAMQTVLRESVCARVSGGKLDFPRHASFAAIKIVTWWEVEFCGAFRHPSGLTSTSDADERRSGKEEDRAAIKKTLPSEFILLIIDTSEQLLEHLHTLIQESLDHADLTVLTATLGAAALVRNCLWCYSQRSKDKIPEQSSARLLECYRSYNEMAEAVAERLLDLHCRLISLYILNEADSLSWQRSKSFFEKERCSFTIQMWWLYMQGSKADLWNTVSPRMAQRVFAGMLNESLSIIATRFIHGRPSLARSEQFWADAFNVLCCSAYLALSASLDSDELLGLRANKLSVAMRDIHAKSSELLVCLLLRGTPLRLLYQGCRNGLDTMTILQQQRGPAPWLLVCAPKLLGSSVSCQWKKPLPARARLVAELNVLRMQPHPSWTQLLKVFSMDECIVARLLMSTLVRQCVGCTESAASSASVDGTSAGGCGGFLCAGSACDRSPSSCDAASSPSLCLFSIAYVTANSFMDPLCVAVPSLKHDSNWSNYLDRQQVWNQARPPWLNALLAPLRPIIDPIVETLLDAVKTGASIYQAMSLALACLTELYMCVPVRVLSASLAINENLPAHSHPLGGSVLLQALCAALYSALLRRSLSGETEETREARGVLKQSPGEGAFDPRDVSASATALAEALCSIDEDNKHTDQIDALLTRIEHWIEMQRLNECKLQLENMPAYIETYTDQLLFTDVGRRSLKVAHEYLIRTSDWVLKNLEQGERIREDFSDPSDVFVSSKALTYVMFHIEEASFDQVWEKYEYLENPQNDCLKDDLKLRWSSMTKVFLINFNEANWQNVFKIPLSGTVERVRSQILLRPEFKNLGELTLNEKEVAKSIKQLCSVGRSTRFR